MGMSIVGKCPKCELKKGFPLITDTQMQVFTYECPRCKTTVHVKPDDLNVENMDNWQFNHIVNLKAITW